ncbi:hypothetical protein AVEN_211552-1 [Araneus ventricosus]|uniref:Uncharacterized protein n=1 Tax=Araneus ventricosus TaxID=182803 RepID=A0A4Y2D9V9_ARAVE|nr:hypothetical protein AVEN_211552-1 [Araneus ventricosus]
MAAAIETGYRRKNPFRIGRFLIGTLPIAMVLMTRLSENFCKSSQIMTPTTPNHPSLKRLFRIRNSVKEEFDGFYVRCIAYLDLWENSFGKTEQFAWVNLTKTNATDWENAETSAEIINSSLLDVPDMKINNDELFHEVVLAKEYLQSNWEQWKQEEATRDVIISSEEKWLRLFGHFKENHIASDQHFRVCLLLTWDISTS